MCADAHLAALALEHEAAVATYDADFGRFPEGALDQPQGWRGFPRRLGPYLRSLALADRSPTLPT